MEKQTLKSLHSTSVALASSPRCQKISSPRAVSVLSDEERMLHGTWCTPELAKAVELGYIIVTIHEVWHFNERRKSLFSDYVKQWLKIKQESTGYPAWADTDGKKREYVANYKAHEGIELNPDMIKEKKGRKTTAKLMLNSFWGKFGENLNKSAVTTVDSPAALFQMVSDPLHPVQTIRICNDDLLEVVYKSNKSYQLDNGKRNIFIAAFTTFLAQLKLYE